MKQRTTQLYTVHQKHVLTGVSRCTGQRYHGDWACSAPSSESAVVVCGWGEHWPPPPTVTTRHPSDSSLQPLPPRTLYWRLKPRSPRRSTRPLGESPGNKHTGNADEENWFCWNWDSGEPGLNRFTLSMWTRWLSRLSLSSAAQINWSLSVTISNWWTGLKTQEQVKGIKVSLTPSGLWCWVWLIWLFITATT